MMTTVAQATILYRRVLVYSPISSFLFTSSNMKIKTNGSTMPFTTCDKMEILIKGRPGVRMTPAPAAIKIVYNQ